MPVECSRMSGVCTLHWSGSGSHDAGIRDAASRTKAYHQPVCRNKFPLGTSETIVDRCYIIALYFFSEELRSPGLGAVNNIDVLLHPSLTSRMTSGHSMFIETETDTGSDKSQSGGIQYTCVTCFMSAVIVWIS